MDSDEKKSKKPGEAKEPKQRSGLARLLNFAGERKAFTYLGCALSGISQLLSFGPFVCIWFVARDLIEVAPNCQNATNIATYGWAAVAFAAASIIVYFCALMCTHLAAFRTAANMRKATTEHLMRLPLGFFDTHATGELRRIIDGCAAQTETLLAHMLPDCAGSVVMVVGMLVMLFAFDWRLGVSCLVAVVISIACLMSMMSGKGMEFMKQYMGALTSMNKTGTEYVRGIPVVKVFQQTVYSFKAFHDSITEYAAMAQNYAVNFCRPPQVTQLTVLNGLVIFLVPTAILLAPGEGDFARFLTNFAFYAIFSAIIPTAMTKLMFMSEAAQMAGDAMSEVGKLLDTPALPAPATPRRTNGTDIAFDNVSFTYEGATAPALDGVTFAAPAASTVALVGPSGSGKSTAASLVPRFWDVSAGSVRIGGTDVRDMDPADLMGQVAFVFQTNQLFAQSLADNVRAARPDATDAEVLAALSAAQCDDIVAKLPQGINTQLGTGGAYLSGGEVQRVALARAILKDAPIVVLDEATAFADPENEALIQRALAHLAAGRTVLMIAHRLSTVVGADNIVVLDGGHVAEQGTHAQLVAAGGLYARMWGDYEQAVSWKIASDATKAGSAAPGAAAAKGGDAR
ncbi:ABC transporter ATP-binding protein [Senegalimassilia faecalis]|uniref:ABC transporter ATP-binding protein n=1 Tax=Senegalimassilia faecalis TaxID=2509433 RepID=UPI00307823FD